MKTAVQFIWKTLIGGVLFLIPLLLLLLITREAIRFVAGALRPVATHIPIKPHFGLETPEIAAAILLLVIGFTAGLVARTGIAARLSLGIEQLVLRKMPGYTLFKSVAQSAAGLEEGSEADGGVKVALANIDDAWLMGLIIEQHKPTGLLTVFIPSAPTPTAGSIYYLTERQVKRVNVPVSKATKCIMQLGVGSRELLDQVNFSER